MASIFTKIVNGEIPCYKIAEDENYLAFLDINPLEKGHTLVIPKKETDYIFEIEDDAFAGLHIFSKKVAKALHKAVPCKRIAMAVLGLEVPHAHIHLIPMNDLGATNFMKPKLKLPAAEMEEIAEKIRKAL
ncbi:MAG: HIT family protein [Bacteroidales bacterium]|nr:HIT family protein [Bacteroidales bacterium]